MTRTVLHVEGLSKAYRSRIVLRDLTFSVGAGEAVAIIGPNGAGKSTLLGCLTGERVPTTGRVVVGGADPLEDPRGAAAALGFVPEHPFLYGELTVAEMLRFVIEARGLDAGAGRIEAERLLAAFGLANAEGVLCRELSQGMARKVAITASLLHSPQVLILDEVFNGLDQPSTRSLLRELDERRSRGAGVLVSSHDLELLAGWCDRGLLLAPERWVSLEGQAWAEWKRSPGLAVA